MIAAIMVQHILEPQMSTLAGGMGALIYDAKSDKIYYLDAELDHTAKGAPITPIMAMASGVGDTSGRRIGVPGIVAGLRAAAERFGTVKWADYFPPAIHLAEQGFPMHLLPLRGDEQCIARTTWQHALGARSSCPKGSYRLWARS